MFHPPYHHHHHHHGDHPMHHHWHAHHGHGQHMSWGHPHWSHHDHGMNMLKDHGRRPYVVDIERAARMNNTFRTALWTGKHLQLTLMSIGVGEDIGLEVHPHTDQFLCIEDGRGLVQMGDSRHRLDFRAPVSAGSAIFVPAGKWHNLTNTGHRPIKLYSIYAPPAHRFGTVHRTKAEAMAAEHNHY